MTYEPRAQWHTFWNAGAEPARILEIISLAAGYGAEVDFERTMPVIERHGLSF